MTSVSELYRKEEIKVDEMEKMESLVKEIESLKNRVVMLEQWRERNTDDGK